MPFYSSTASAPAEIVAENEARRKALIEALAEFYPKPVSIVLELGCGHGHFLTAYAAANPATTCLGVDLATMRIARAERKRGRMGLDNAHFLKADAAETVAALPDHVRLKGIFTLFPDPWPKNRHLERRLLHKELLDNLAVRAENGAWLAVRTDHAGYFEWAREQIEAHPQWRLAPEIGWPFEHPTVFQEMQGPHQSLVAARR